MVFQLLFGGLRKIHLRSADLSGACQQRCLIVKKEWCQWHSGWGRKMVSLKAVWTKWLDSALTKQIASTRRVTVWWPSVRAWVRSLDSTNSAQHRRSPWRPSQLSEWELPPPPLLSGQVSVSQLTAAPCGLEYLEVIFFPEEGFPKWCAFGFEWWKMSLGRNVGSYHGLGLCNHSYFLELDLYGGWI